MLELMGKGLNLLSAGRRRAYIGRIRRVDYEDPNRRALLPGLFSTRAAAAGETVVFPDGREGVSGRSHADRTQPPDKWLLVRSAGSRRFSAASSRSAAGKGSAPHSTRCARASIPGTSHR